MMDALRFSTESRDLVERARDELRGIIGNIVKRKKERRESGEQGMRASPMQRPVANVAYVPTNITREILGL